MSTKAYFTGGRGQFNNANDFKIRLEGVSTSGMVLGSDSVEEFFKNGATIISLTVEQQVAPNGATQYHLALEGVNLASTVIDFVATTGTTTSFPSGAEEDIGVNEGFHFRGKRVSGTNQPIMSFSVKVLRL